MVWCVILWCVLVLMSDLFFDNGWFVGFGFLNNFVWIFICKIWCIVLLICDMVMVLFLICVSVLLNKVF